MDIQEYRGVEGLVAAEVIKDSSESYETGEVFEIAGVAEISRTVNSSSATHYYDNKPAIVINSDGEETITISTSVIPLDVKAKLLGRVYDENLAMYIGGERKTKYFAIGYKTKLTDGTEMYVWRLKGTFNDPDESNKTVDNSTDGNGQQLVYTNISTIHKFAKNNNESAPNFIVNGSKTKGDIATFFDTVKTPDTFVVRG